MMLSELARRMGGELFGDDRLFSGFATDSREVFEGCAFLAIVGDRSDGHEFVSVAREGGAVCSIVTREVQGDYVLVPNLVEALARFGQSVRSEFSGPVVGITGSNGKTSTKELVAAALSPLGEVLKSEGNKNTEYTSPLVWHRLTEETRAVVVEMGMRGFGQIRALAEIARPTVGLITNIGTAHIEKVGDRAGILRAKSELLQALDGDGVAVLPGDSEFLEDLRRKCPGRILTFGTAMDCDVRVVGYRQDSWTSSTVLGRYGREDFEVRLPTIGQHQSMNVGAAMAAAVACGVPVSEAALAIEAAKPMPMRMEVIERGGVTVLLDTYNASPDSTIAALRALEGGSVVGRRIAILGEMKELGDFTEGGHRLVGEELEGSQIDLLVLTGGPTRFIEAAALASGFPSGRIVSFGELDIDRVRGILGGAVSGDVVLIKGSRALGLERALDGAVVT